MTNKTNSMEIKKSVESMVQTEGGAVTSTARQVYRHGSPCPLEHSVKINQISLISGSDKKL